MANRKPSQPRAKTAKVEKSAAKAAITAPALEDGGKLHPAYLKPDPSHDHLVKVPDAVEASVSELKLPQKDQSEASTMALEAAVKPWAISGGFPSLDTPEVSPPPEGPPQPTLKAYPDLGFIQGFGEVSKLLVGQQHLDIGCGSGRALKVLGASGAGAEGVDISGDAVKMCLEGSTKATQGDAMQLPFPDNAFDTTFSLHALEHIVDLGKAVGESLRVAKYRAIHLVALGPSLDETQPAHAWTSMQDFKEAILSIDGLQGIAKQFSRMPNPDLIDGNVGIVVLDKQLRVTPPVLEHIQPFTVIPNFVSLVGSSVKSDSPQDIDILIRNDGPFAGMELRLRNLFPKQSGIREKLHFVYSPPGPHDDHVPLFDLVAVPKHSFALSKVEKQADEGNLDFNEGDSGTGIFQTHERGLFQQQAKLTGSFGWDPIELSAAQLGRLSKLVGEDVKTAYNQAQDGDSSRLSSLLDKVIGADAEGKAGPEFDKLHEADKKLLALASPVSIHTDFRLRRGDDQYWEGGEGFTPGNQFRTNKIRDIQAGDEAGKVLMNFKVREEAVSKGAIIRGPIEWLTVGRGSPKVFPPGAAGSTKNTWSRFHIRESFKWMAGIQDEHFKEFWIDDGPISGRWLVQFAPVGAGTAQAGGRAWMFSKPKDQVPKSEILQEHLEKSMEVKKSIWCPIVKADDEKRLITGIVLQPEIVDAQGDIVSADAIEMAAHKFLSDYNRITQMGLQHQGFPGGIHLVESWVAPSDMKLSAKNISKGTWMITVHVPNDDVWSKVKAGNIRGFSIGGVAKVQRLAQ